MRRFVKSLEICGVRYAPPVLLRDASTHMYSLASVTVVGRSVCCPERAIRCGYGTLKRLGSLLMCISMTNWSGRLAGWWLISVAGGWV
jgi:hypothetical protein